MGAACEYMGRRPVVCQVGAMEVETSSRCVFAFAEALGYNALTYGCVLHCQARLVYFFVVTELWGGYRLEHT